VQRFFLLLIPVAGLISCSSSWSDSGLEPASQGATVTEIDKKGGNNPFAFKNEDIEKGDNGSITGGKRSMYDSKSESAYAKANGSLPEYLQRSYQKKAWAGGKNYSAGSYQTGTYGQSDKKSWFGGKKSNEVNQVARGFGQDFSTGSYRTGVANETGRGVVTGSNAYVEGRNRDGWGRIPTILSESEHRRLSMGQAKSLLGR
jgi:hypothetical protein|tara:strand:- start:5985 stop:6590 length:606 start_codon:yes stop_codon:yes gene_type:complete